MMHRAVQLPTDRTKVIQHYKGCSVFHGYRPLTEQELTDIGENLRRRKSRYWEGDIAGLVGITNGRVSQLKKKPYSAKRPLTGLLRFYSYSVSAGLFGRVLATSQVRALDWDVTLDPAAWPEYVRNGKEHEVISMTRRELFYIGGRLASGRRDHTWSALCRYTNLSPQWMRRLRNDPAQVPRAVCCWLRLLSAAHPHPMFERIMATACGYDAVALDAVTLNRYRYIVQKPPFDASRALAKMQG